MRRQRHNAVEQDEVTMLADYFGFSAPPDAHQAGRRLSARLVHVLRPGSPWLIRGIQPSGGGGM
jgi:hypothetical protein